MKTGSLACVLLLACATSGLSCAKPEGEALPPPVSLPFTVVIAAYREGREPLAGVGIWTDKKLLGTSAPSGTVRVSLDGSEGDRTALEIKCPESYASPERPIQVGLRRLAPGSPPPRFEVECVSLVHQLVIGMRVENGANLPILRFQTEVGRTDGFGVAHVLLEAAADEQVALTVDTSQNKSLLPQNPSLSFVAPEHDELILLQQKLSVKRAPSVVRRVSRPGPIPLR